MRIRMLIPGTLILGFAMAASAQVTPEAQDILNGVEQAYAGVSTFQGQGSMDINMTSPQTTVQEKTDMQMELKSPGLMHISMSSPSASVVMVSNGNTMWMYMPTLKVYSKITGAAAQDQQTSTGDYDVFRKYEKIASQVDQAAVTRSESLMLNGASTDCWVVHVQFKPTPTVTSPLAGANVSIVSSQGDLWIDKSTDWVVRDSRDDQMRFDGVLHDNKNSLTFEKIAVNGAIPDSEFEFTPPADSHQLDLTGVLSSFSKPQQ